MSPDSATELTEMVIGLVFVNVNACDALAPTVVEGNVYVAGVKVAVGAVALPETDTDCMLPVTPLALSVTVNTAI